jgi:hypothetical protein
MPHHNQSIRERVITLVEEGIERYRETEETSRRPDTGFWHVSSEAEDTRLVDEARENRFLNSIQPKRTLL